MNFLPTQGICLSRAPCEAVFEQTVGSINGINPTSNSGKWGIAQKQIHDFYLKGGGGGEGLTKIKLDFDLKLGLKF